VKEGVIVYAVLEPLGTSTPASWFARWMLFGVYEMQRRYISEETKRKMKFAAREGNL